MLQTMKWKLLEHSDLVRYGVEHSLVKDFISYNYRKSQYKYWCELPGQLAALKGFKFSENTPSTALREIFLEEVYNVDGFKPETGQTVINVGANYGDSSIW